MLGFCAPGGRLTWNRTCLDVQAGQLGPGVALQGEPVQTAGCAGAAVVTVDLKFAKDFFRSFDCPLKSVTRNLSCDLRSLEGS